MLQSTSQPVSISNRANLVSREIHDRFCSLIDNLESNFATQCTPSDSDEQCLADADGQYRLSYDAPVSNADMMQTFLPAFEAVVADANIRGVMCTLLVLVFNFMPQDRCLRETESNVVSRCIQ